MATLTDDRRTQLDGIVSQMEANGEPEENIRFVVSDFQSVHAPVEVQSRGTALENAARNSMAGVVAMPFQALSNAQRAVGDLGEKYGGAPGRFLANTLTAALPNQMFTDDMARRGAELRAETEQNFPVDSERFPVISAVGAAVPQAAAMIGSMAVAGPAGPFLLGAGMGAQSGFESADQIGLTSPEARLAMAGGFAGVEAGIERFGGIGAKQALGGVARRIFKGIGSEALEEPVTGAAQALMSAAGASTVLDPERPGFTTSGFDLTELDPRTPQFRQNRLMEAIGGAAGGTVFAPFTALANRPAPQISPSPSPQVPQSSTPDLPESLGDLTAEDVADLDAPPAFTVPADELQTPSLETATTEKPSPTFTGSNVQTGTEMPVPGSIPGEAPALPVSPSPSLPVSESSPTASVTPGPQPTAESLPAPSELAAGSIPATGAISAEQATALEAVRSRRTPAPILGAQGPASTGAGSVSSPQIAPEITGAPMVSRATLPTPGETAQPPSMRASAGQARLGDEAGQPPSMTAEGSARPSAAPSPEPTEIISRKGFARRSVRIPARTDGVPRDMVDLVREMGGLDRPPRLKRDRMGRAENQFGEHDAMRRFRKEMPAYYNALTREGGRGVDKLADDAATGDSPLLPEADIDALIETLMRDIEARRTQAREAGVREKELARQENEALRTGKRQDAAWNKATAPGKGKIGVTPYDLTVGDTLEVDGEQMNVIEVTLNEDGDVEGALLEDGDKFGRQWMSVGELAYVDEANLEQFAPPPVSPSPSPQVPQSLDSLLTGTESTRPRNAGETTRAQVEDVLAELMNATRAGEADRAQGKLGFKNLNTSGTTAGFLNREIVTEALDLIQRGFTNFTDWSRAMITRFGQRIRDYLEGVWQAARKTSQAGFVGGDPLRRQNTEGTGSGPPEMRETQSRFAAPDPNAFVYEVKGNAQMLAEANAWLDTHSTEEALQAVESNTPPEGLRVDNMPALGEQLIQRLTAATNRGNEIEQLQAESLLIRAARAWEGQMSQEAGRTFQQRAAASARLLPIAPVLAAKQVLVDRADAVMNRRFDGGTAGVTRKMQDLNDRINKALPRMLDVLRLKMFPGMTWADIFTDLPSTQKERQREIYRRLKLDERLQKLTPAQRLKLANELDQAWQRERRKVFQSELKRAGVLGEKSAGDRARVEKALPKLMRMINLGMFNSEMWREAVAPEYGLRTLTAEQSRNLRKQAEEAWTQPEGVLRNQRMAKLLEGIQRATGASKIEILNSYWTAAVLSGLRTQFDTWAAAINGMGTNLLQISSLLARGRGRAAVEAHGQWWRGLYEGIRESGQILARGDTSYLKRFGADVNRALEGESGASPVPLGELLWKNGNKFQKYGLAPVMMFTGRLMAAADHVNNTATTQGAMAVARALHPEIYGGKAAFTPAERTAARQQALREVTGGTDPTTAVERAQVSARAREILNGSINETQRMEASEIGDMAAFQNDPTGAFGTIYSALKSGLGTAQRKLGAVAEDAEANKASRAMTGLLAGSLHALTGTRFMRFGFNFGAELTRYMPGSYMLGKAGFYGRDVSRMQQELLLGKNVVGLMIASTLAALFVGPDDEPEDDTGVQIEGTWADLTPEQQQQRRTAGLEPMTMWRRKDGKVQRVSYKQWPTMSLFAIVGGMKDEQRHKPKTFEQRGVTGHLIRAAQTGLFQIQNVSAMRGLADLFGSPGFASDPMTEWADRFAKMGTNYAGGMIPTVIKDVEIWNDPRNFKAEGAWEGIARSVPILRTSVNDGRPQLNMLGEEVKLERSPWSRTYTNVESAEAHRVLGSLLARGLSLPLPSSEVSVFQDGVKVPLESLGREAVWKYEKAVGTGYKAWLSDEGSDLLKMPVTTADKIIKRRAAQIKRGALATVRGQ
jgi:hypothetical protein